MSILSIILIVLWAVLLPFFLGSPFDIHYFNDNNKISIARRILFGYVVYCATFQLIAPIFILKHWAFNALFATWLVMIIILLVGTLLYSVRWHKSLRPSWSRDMLKDSKDWLEILVMIGAFAVVVLHAFLLGYFMHFDTDDARFVAEALEAYEKNTLLMYHPINGELLGGPIGEMLKDVWAPYPIFLAVLGKLSMLSPTVLAHTVLPFIYIPLCYMAFYLVAKYFFKDDSKSTWIAVFLFGIVNTFSMETVFSFGWTLLTLVWQGRSLLCVVMLPLLWYVLIRFITEEEQDILDYVIIAIVGVACCMLSGMGAMLVPLMVVSHAFVLMIVKKNIKVPVFMLVATIPTLIYFVLYSKLGGRF